jgi:hypothetical protein
LGWGIKFLDILFMASDQAEKLSQIFRFILQLPDDVDTTRIRRILWMVPKLVRWLAATKETRMYCVPPSNSMSWRIGCIW